MPETHPVAEFSNIHVYDGDDVALTFLFGSPLPSSPFAAPIVIWQIMDGLLCRRRSRRVQSSLVGQ